MERGTIENRYRITQNFNIMHFYTGNIEPMEDVIFVFGRNPEGRHGAGSAYVARNLFGAVYGVGEGITGSSYALPTKDIRVPGTRSISKEQIKLNIEKMYETAKSMPDKKFMVAYRTTENEVSLNGYSGLEMVEMFMSHDVPENVWFSDEWRQIIEKYYQK